MTRTDHENIVIFFFRIDLVETRSRDASGKNVTGMRGYNCDDVGKIFCRNCLLEKIGERRNEFISIRRVKSPRHGRLAVERWRLRPTCSSRNDHEQEKYDFSKHVVRQFGQLTISNVTKEKFRSNDDYSQHLILNISVALSQRFVHSISLQEFIAFRVLFSTKSHNNRHFVLESKSERN